MCVYCPDLTPEDVRRARNEGRLQPAGVESSRPRFRRSAGIAVPCTAASRVVAEGNYVTRSDGGYVPTTDA